MGDLDVLLAGIVAVDVEGVDTADTHHRMPHQRDGNVFTGCVVVLGKVRENRFSFFGLQHLVTGVLFWRHRWRTDLRREVLLDGVNRLCPADEHTQRVHLGLLAGDGEVNVVAPPEAVLLDHATGEVVEVVDVFHLAPAQEMLEAVPVRLNRTLCEFGFLVREVQLEGYLRIDWFETHSRESRTDNGSI